MFEKVEVITENILNKKEYTFTLIGINLILERYCVYNKNQWEKWEKYGQYDKHDKNSSTKENVIKLEERHIDIPHEVKEEAKRKLLSLINVVKESETIF